MLRRFGLDGIYLDMRLGVGRSVRRWWLESMLLAGG